MRLRSRVNFFCGCKVHVIPNVRHAPTILGQLLPDRPYIALLGEMLPDRPYITLGCAGCEYRGLLLHTEPPVRWGALHFVSPAKSRRRPRMPVVSYPAASSCPLSLLLSCSLRVFSVSFPAQVDLVFAFTSRNLSSAFLSPIPPSSESTLPDTQWTFPSSRSRIISNRKLFSSRTGDALSLREIFNSKAVYCAHDFFPSAWSLLREVMARNL